jgi:hypothetical protein
MIIDSKLPGFKSYLSENRLNNGGIKTTIDQSAVAPSEQNNVDLHLDDDTKNSQDSYKKKKEEHKESKEKNEEKVEKIIQSDAEIKGKNLKLLNLL